MTNPATLKQFNQSAALEDVNLFTLDQALQDAVTREGAAAAAGRLTALGAVAGGAEAREHGRLANEHPPRLRTHDVHGHRLDVVEFHPSYHWVMASSIRERLHASVWEHLIGTRSQPPGAHVERAGAFYLTVQMEPGHCCPITMTSAAVPVLTLAPDIAEAWLPKLLSPDYDPRFLPPGAKLGLSFGMGLTERQGGTDVRANTTTATPIDGGGPGQAYRLNGHKWFLSAPMSDAFLMLAQAPGGLSCFLVPRFSPDETVNSLRLVRLKDKLGNRSNASAEIELDNTYAALIGEEGRGVASIIEMVTHTRLDCAVSSAALMRHALATAIHHCRQRSVFGRVLTEQPIMTHVLADLALEVEAATALSFRLARSFDHAADPRAAAWRRLMTPVTKYWVCKVAPGAITEMMECLGGNGYVEDSGIPRLYREAPVNSIWEGSGNVMALDVMRVLQREPDMVEQVLEDLEQTAASDRHLTAALERIRSIFHEPRLLEMRARALVEGLALLAAGTILRMHAPQFVADAFIAARLSGVPRVTYGQGLEWSDMKAILDRALPA